MDESLVERKKTPPPLACIENPKLRNLQDAHVTPSGAVKRRRRSPTPDQYDSTEESDDAFINELQTPKDNKLWDCSIAGPTPVKGTGLASPFGALRKGVTGIKTPASHFMSRLLEQKAGAMASPSKMAPKANMLGRDKAVFSSGSPQKFAATSERKRKENVEVIETFDETGVALTASPVYEPPHTVGLGTSMAVDSTPVGSACFVDGGHVPPIGPSVYGRLLVLGHRETRPFLVCKSDGIQLRKELQFDRNATYILRKQVVPNGLRLVDSNPQTYPLPSAHTDEDDIASERSDSEDELVKTIRIAGTNFDEHKYTFKRDFHSRLFQFGRAREHNDFVVLGKNNEITIIEGSKDSQTVEEYLKEPGWNASSRYAFRIVHRDDETSAIDPTASGTNRVFAAGFDESQDIFFGERALKVQMPKIDGLTTYGLYIWKPSVGKWMEVSAVHGECFEPRVTRDTPGKRLLASPEQPSYTNELEDGTLLWNAKWTLMWRCQNAPSRLSDFDLKSYRESISRCTLLEHRQNSEDEQCLTGMSKRSKDMKRASSEPDLAKPDETRKAEPKLTTRPYIFSDCGHVVRCSKSSHEIERLRKCPECQRVSTLAPLVLYPVPDLISAPPTCAFVPCGHAIDEGGKALWDTIKFPKEVENLQDHELWGVNEKYRKLCPFCSQCFTKIVSLTFTTGPSAKMPSSTNSSISTLYETNFVI